MAPSSQQAQIAALRSWANTRNRSARTAPARLAMLAKFEKQVDPDGTMDPAARTLAADAARRAYYLELSMRGVAARRRAS